MSKNSNHQKGHQPGIVCTAPDLGALVPDYVVEQLSDLDAEKVENHLLECKGCRQMYLTILFTRERGRRRRLAGKENLPAMPGDLGDRPEQG